MPQPTTQQRWTADTRTAFLLALELRGSALKAAKAIGRQPAVCYKVRERDAGFAAEWDRIVKAQRKRRKLARTIGPEAVVAAVGTRSDVGAGAPGLRDAAGHRQRRDGFTVVKRRAFLRVLSETGAFAAACRAAGVSDTTVQRLRDKDADFAAACERALKTAGPTLNQIARERAVEGWDEPIFKNGVQVGTRRRYSDQLLNTLLIEERKAAAIASDPVALVQRAEEVARAAGGEFVPFGSREDTNAALIRMLDKIDRKRGRPPATKDDVAEPEASEAGTPTGPDERAPE